MISKRSFSLVGWFGCLFWGHRWAVKWCYDFENWKAHDCTRCGHSGVEFRHGKRYRQETIGGKSR